MPPSDGVGVGDTADDMDPLVGWRTEALAFESRLGAGAMGAVYRGRQLRLDRPVAIKVIAPHFAANRSYRERFDREARTLARLAHQNVITCFDFGPVPGPDGKPLLIMVMELVDGTAVAEIRASLARAVLELYRQAAEGLAAAHALGIVHRDVKPTNIMVTRSGVTKLADFGLAKAEDSTGLTMTGTVVGTPSYMAPEVCRGKETIPASDIYSLGCSLFESLTGHPPYRVSSSLEAIQCHINAPVPLLAERVPELAMLDGLVGSLLAKDPAKRPTAAALARALGEWRERIPPTLAASDDGQRQRSAQATMSIAEQQASGATRPSLAVPVEGFSSLLPTSEAEADARPLKAIEPGLGASGSESGGQARPADETAATALRAVDLGLDSPPRFVTPITSIAGRRDQPQPAAETRVTALPVPATPDEGGPAARQKDFVLPDHLRPQPETAAPPPISAAAPAAYGAPAAATPAGASAAAKPAEQPSADARKASQARLREQRDQLKDAAHAQRVAEAREHEAQGDAHAAAKRWAAAIAAYERAAKAAPAEVARRLLLAKAEAIRSRRGPGRVLIVAAILLLAAAGGGLAWQRMRPEAEPAEPMGTASTGPSTPAPPGASAADRVTALERMADDPAVDALAVRDEARTLLPQAGGRADRVKAILARVEPEAATLEAKLAEIAAAERARPAHALELAAALRSSGTRLGALAARLPLPARLAVRGAAPEAVRIAIGGVALPPSADLIFCRRANAPTTLAVSAPGRRPASAVVPADPSPKEHVVELALLDQPLWTMPADLPWAALSARGDAVLAIWPHGVALLAAGDGAARARLDPAKLAGAPRGNLSWLPPEDAGAAELHLASDDGQGWFVPTRADGFGEGRLVRRGGAGVALAFDERELVFHVGKHACFAAERIDRAQRLIATCGDEELWTLSLQGKRAPWLRVGDESLAVLDDAALRVIDQEGQTQQLVPLDSTRTGAVAALDGGRCVAFATASGAGALRQADGRWSVLPAPRLTGARDPLLAADGALLLLATGGEIELLRLDGAAFASQWSVALGDKRKALSVSLAGGWACVADDAGALHVFAAADGKPARTLELPDETTGPALVAGGVVVVPDIHGLSGYRLGP